jgi:hypothetical protein
MSFDDKKFTAVYARERPRMRKALNRLRGLLKEVVGNLEDKNLVRARLVSFRIKSRDSLRRKALLKGWPAGQAVSYAGDLIGARVVCSNLDDVRRFAELLREAIQRIANQPIEIQDYVRNPQRPSSGQYQSRLAPAPNAPPIVGTARERYQAHLTLPPRTLPIGLSAVEPARMHRSLARREG